MKKLLLVLLIIFSFFSCKYVKQAEELKIKKQAEELKIKIDSLQTLIDLHTPTVCDTVILKHATIYSKITKVVIDTISRIDTNWVNVFIETPDTVTVLNYIDTCDDAFVYDTVYLSKCALRKMRKIHK